MAYPWPARARRIESYVGRVAEAVWLKIDAGLILRGCESDMVHLFLFPTSRDSALRGLLVEELRSQVLPLLQSLAFQIFRPRDKGTRGFPTRYYRSWSCQIDIIHFVWMKWGQPAFIIDFDVIDDLVRFPSIAKERKRGMVQCSPIQSTFKYQDG